MVGYLAMMRFTQIRVLTGEADYSELECEEYDWAKTMYGNIQEHILEGLPDPLGNYVTLCHYYDANLNHDLVTGLSITGILHFMNKIPIDWYSKEQAMVEMATYGSKFIAVLTKSWTSGELFIILVSLSMMSVTSLETTGALSRVPLSPMLSFITSAMHFPFTGCRK